MKSRDPKRDARNNIRRSAINHVRLIGHRGDHSKQSNLFFLKAASKNNM